MASWSSPGEAAASRTPWLLLILGLSLLLNVVGVNWGLPSQNGWAMDEITPAEVMAGIGQHFANGWHSKYPPLHYYVLGLFYLPLLLLKRLPALAGVSDFTYYTIFFYIGRCLSVIMATATVFLVYRTASEWLERRAALAAAFITAFSGTFVFYAKIVNVDIPYVFWFSVSLLFFVRILKRHAVADYVWFALATVAAIATKDQAYGLYVLAPIPIVLARYRQLRRANPGAPFRQAICDRRNVIALMAALAAFMLLFNWPFNFSGFMMHVRTITGGASAGYRIYEKTLAGHGHMFVQAVAHLRFVLGWPLFVICLLGVFRELLRKKKDFLLLSMLLLVLSYYGAFISVVMYHYERFMLPVALLLAFFGGRLLADFCAWRRGPRLAKAIALALLAAFSLWHAVSVDTAMLLDSRYKVERWMKRAIGPDRSVGFVGLVQCLPRSAGMARRHFIFSSQSPLIEGLRPDFLVVNPACTIGAPHFNERPRLEKIGYSLVMQYRTPLKWVSFNQATFFRNGRDVIYSNLDKINPEIRVYGLREALAASPKGGSL